MSETTDGPSASALWTVDRLLADPHFDAAVDCLTDGLIAMYGDDLLLVRSLFEFDRALTFMIAISQYFAERPDDPTTWLTLANLQRGVTKVGIDAPRRVRRLIEEMRADGLLVPATPGQPGREHRFRPSERALELDREWLKTFHAPLARLDPSERRYADAVAMLPEYQAAYRRPSIAVLSVADRIIHRNHAFEYFLSQSAGIRIMALLMASIRGSADGAPPPGLYSWAAQRSGTSRAHIRNVLRGAADLGFVRIANARDRRVTVLPTLVEGYRRWVADSLSSTDWVSALGHGLIARDPVWR